MKNLIILFIILLAFSTCIKPKQACRDLSYIDSLLIRNKKDSAYNAFLQFDKSILRTPEDSAYYNLLKTELFFIKDISLPNDSLINSCIKYYSDKNNKDLLARAYYFKGRILFDRGAKKDGTQYLKRAEAMLTSLKDNSLKCRILINLAVNNSIAGEFKLALDYAKPALMYAEQSGRKDLEENCLENIGNIYGYLGKRDSAFFYIAKCESYIKYMEREDQAYTYGSLGAAYEAVDTKKAKAYILRSISIQPLAFTYHILASIYAREDSIDKIEESLNKALLLSRDIDRRIMVMDDLKGFYHEKHQYKKEAAMADSILRLKDNLQEQRNRDSIKSIQAYYDTMAEMDKKISIDHNKTWLITGCIIAIIISMSAAYYLYFHKKQKQALLMKQKEIEVAKNDVQQSKVAYANQSAEVRKLHDKIKKIEKDIDKDKQKLLQTHHTIVESGHRLWENVNEGQTIITWSKTDVTNFILYYLTIDEEFAKRIENDYQKLTRDQKVFLILQHMGKSDEEISRITGISNTAVRMKKSRIKKQKKELSK